MRFLRRADEATPEEAPTPVDAPPPGRVVATFAGVLDGRRLWVSVDERPGTLGLRDIATGDVLALPDDAADDQPGHLAARLDLASLPHPVAGTPTTYDVVLVPLGGAKPRPLWTPPLPGHRPPPTPDGLARLSLERGDDGSLRVRHELLPVAAELVAISAGSDAVTLHLSTSGTALRLLGEGGVELASWPAEHDVVTLSAAGLDPVAPQVARLALDDLPVRRRGNDLAEPGRAVPLPQLYDGDSDRARLRLRWSAQGLLQARVFAAGPSDDGEGES